MHSVYVHRSMRIIARTPLDTMIHHQTPGFHLPVTWRLGLLAAIDGAFDIYTNPCRVRMQYGTYAPSWEEGRKVL